MNKNVLVINGSADLYGSSRILLQVLAVMAPRKVILIVPAHGPLTEIIRSMSTYNHISVNLMPDMPLVARNMNSPGGAARVIRQLYSFRSKLKTIIRSNRIDYAYVNTLTCFLTLRALRSLNVPSILHVHEMLEHDRKVTRLISRKAVAWADKTISVSGAVRENLLKSCPPVYASKINVVLNGIHDKYRPSAQSSAGIVTVTYFGRIIVLKGIWFLLDAIAQLPPEVMAQSCFRIYGGPAPGGEHLVEQLKNDISKHPACEHIIFSPFVEDITEALNNSDIVVVPSLLKDSFPTTVLEGMSAGKPVIATNTGGAKESIVEGITGFLINPHATDQLAVRLKILITDNAQRSKMGAAARQQFLERFTIASFNDRISKELTDFENTGEQ